MSATALEAIGKVFTEEVLDIILREGLIDYYDVVDSFGNGTGVHPDDVKHNKVILKALAVVIQDFMSHDEYIEWLKEKAS